jgi:hypothetical protein
MSPLLAILGGIAAIYSACCALVVLAMLRLASRADRQLEAEEREEKPVER